MIGQTLELIIYNKLSLQFYLSLLALSLWLSLPLVSILSSVVGCVCVCTVRVVLCCLIVWVGLVGLCLIVLCCVVFVLGWAQLVLCSLVVLC
jgi:hypothetical protein